MKQLDLIDRTKLLEAILNPTDTIDSPDSLIAHYNKCIFNAPSNEICVDIDDDLIRRRDAIDYLTGWNREMLDKELCYILRLVPTANTWISTADRLPDEDGKYLVITDGTQNEVFDIASFYKECNFCQKELRFNYWNKASKILFWMPKPPLPKGIDEINLNKTNTIKPCSDYNNGICCMTDTCPGIQCLTSDSDYYCVFTDCSCCGYYKGCIDCKIPEQQNITKDECRNIHGL